MTLNWLQNDVDFSPPSDQWIAGWRLEMNNVDIDSPRYKELQTLIEERMRELDATRRKKPRTWYVSELTVNAVPVGPQSSEAVFDKQRIGTVEAPSRAEATRLARERWPNKTIEITRGSQG